MIPPSPTYARNPLALPDESCAAFVHRCAARFADRPALAFEDVSLSYAALSALVARHRENLARSGLTRGSRLALSMATSPACVATTLAALELGVTVVPIYDSAPAAEVVAKCAAAAVDAIAVDPGQAALRRAELDARIPVLSAGDGGDNPLKADSVRDAPRFQPTPDDIAVMPFSSGSTGEPKLVLLSHRNILASRLLFAAATHLDAQSVLVHFLPLSHVYGWMALTAALASGAKVVLHARYDFDRLIADIERHRATAVFAVSQTIIDLERGNSAVSARIGSLRWVNTGAAPLAPSIMRDVSERLGLAITTGYGLTEAAPVAHTAVERRDLVDVEVVGFPVANTRLRLIDPDDPARPLRPDSAGELAVAGPQVELGYRLADGTLDRSAWLDDGSFRTGDLVEFDAIGRVRIVGRIKNIIKYKGYSVAPAELEAILARHPAVRDCAVIGKLDVEAGEIPVAFIVTRRPAPSADEILSFVRQQVAPQRRVREVVFVDEIPRSQAGKVMVRQLLNQV